MRTRRLAGCLAALPAALLVSLVSTTVAPPGALAVPTAPDQFICYATRSKLAVTANLADVLDSGSYTSKGARILCTPADPNLDLIDDPVTHLKGYRITGPHTTRSNLPVENQFGTFMFNTTRARALLVPALKSLPPAPPPPDPNTDPNSQVDHYRCVLVRITPGTTRFPKGITAQVADQFGTRILAIKKPLKLCVPTDKNGEGIKHADRQLMCYWAVLKPPTKVDAAQVTDQFGTETLKLTKEAELCVPSTAPTLGSPSGAFVD